ncbi:MAG: DnaD domain protein [Clostridiales bacterium]|nr:DnaD domain protein [Clostridiales bacterium]
MIKFDANYSLYENTPVENLFIMQFLSKAPSDYVKMYLFLLNKAYFPDAEPTSISSLSTFVNMDVSVCRRALLYWERLGLLSVTFSSTEDDAEYTVEFHSAKDIFFNSQPYRANVLYSDAEFNNSLSEIFKPRILDIQDYVFYQELPKIYSVSSELVLYAVQECVKKHSCEVSYFVVEKQLMEWVDAGLTSPEAVKELTNQITEYSRELNQVLKYLGFKRTHTMPELKCYTKWRKDWGFAFNTILEACNTTTGASNPNIKYLDSILEQLKNNSVTSPKEVREQQNIQTSERKAIKELLFFLGIAGSASAVHTRLYKKWTKEFLFSHESIMLCASALDCDSSSSMSSLDMMLEALYSRCITSYESVAAYLADLKKYDDYVKLVNTHVKGMLSDTERTLIKTWIESYNMPIDVILYAAELAQSTKKPWQYMNKIISRWNTNSVKNIADARADSQRFADSQSADTPKSKKSGFENIDNHSYTDEQLNSLYEKFSDD